MPIQYVKGVGPKRALLFKKLGVETLNDLIYFIPKRYEDRSNLKPINSLESDTYQTVLCYVVDVQEERVRNNLTLVKARVRDNTGEAIAIWFNQTYLKNILKKGTKLYLYGNITRRFGRVEIQNPDYEIADSDETIHTGRIIPVYPLTEGLSQKIVRGIIWNTLNRYIDELEEFIPIEILDKYGFPDIKSAIQGIHFPDSEEILRKARERLAFEEFFLLQLAILRRRMSLLEENAPIIKVSKEMEEKFFRSLPFELTNAQKRVIEDIKRDIASGKSMQRLLQGDVGSGKTVVAAYFLYVVASNGYQSAIMAPTEILAQQHYDRIGPLLANLGLETALLIGSTKEKEKQQIKERLALGELPVIIGTHALIQEDIEFKNLVGIVIDEQHRFGVMQRMALRSKGLSPHFLVMSATPIPRTLALTLYGDLDISVIDELPSGRLPVATYWASSEQRAQVYNMVRKIVKSGQQAYIVCPLIEESEKLEAESAVALAKKMQEEVFPEFKVGLLHGKMSISEKEEVMNRFRSGDINILVSTTVIEVGVDVPNATVMVIENAERFGLSQLHQLRGRVGRGSLKSYCILISDLNTEEARERIKIMTKTQNGFEIAEADLRLRGPGELNGTRQHGIPDFKVGNIIRDARMLELAREEAINLLRKDPNLSSYKKLREKVDTSRILEFLSTG
ncbi:ATP-dependent DNA helicase RecG [bacterium]|nr:ATP-dependent DNA helicase RecG [bacterium]